MPPKTVVPPLRDIEVAQRTEVADTHGVAFLFYRCPLGVAPARCPPSPSQLATSGVTS